MVIEADGSLGRVRPACRCPNPVFGPVDQGAGRPSPQDVSLPSADRANGYSYGGFECELPRYASFCGSLFSDLRRRPSFGTAEGSVITRLVGA